MTINVTVFVVCVVAAIFCHALFLHSKDLLTRMMFMMIFAVAMVYEAWCVGIFLSEFLAIPGTVNIIRIPCILASFLICTVLTKHASKMMQPKNTVTP